MPAALAGVLRGAEAGFGAAVTLSVRSSNWIPNTQRSAETLERRESKGRGIGEIKRGILPGPQRPQLEGWGGPIWRGKGQGEPEQAALGGGDHTGLLSSSLVLPHLTHTVPWLVRHPAPHGGLGIFQGLASYSCPL